MSSSTDHDTAQTQPGAWAGVEPGAPLGDRSRQTLGVVWVQPGLRERRDLLPGAALVAPAFDGRSLRRR
ncbi:hypothetical protein BA895_02550 [Humibacillus sp. DSM 29435]|nr:hypothetical protein BA895_02550 [Humibacillus sp. DSM 29435]